MRLRSMSCFASTWSHLSFLKESEMLMLGLEAEFLWVVCHLGSPLCGLLKVLELRSLWIRCFWLAMVAVQLEVFGVLSRRSFPLQYHRDRVWKLQCVLFSFCSRIFCASSFSSPSRWWMFLEGEPCLEKLKTVLIGKVGTVSLEFELGRIAKVTCD